MTILSLPAPDDEPMPSYRNVFIVAVMTIVCVFGSFVGGGM